MPKQVVILCDERDTEIAESIREALHGRGLSAAITACDAAAETLGAAPREAMVSGAAVVVVVREGGRGNRLLRAVEDETLADTPVLSLLADASPDAAVSSRTEARIRTLCESLSASLGAGSSAAAPDRRWQLAALIAAALLVVLVLLRFWPGGLPGGGPPVMLTGVLSSSGWMITFHLREEAGSLEYKRPTDAAFVATGDSGPGAGPNLGQRHAKTHVILPDVRGKVPFQVRYTTLDGAQRGPYEAVFDSTAEAVSSVKRMLGDIPEWIAFGSYSGRKSCYFSTLLTFKYALTAIRYGIDTAVPDRTVRFVPSDVPGIHNDDQIYIQLPDDASYVTIELVFRDATSLGPKRFPVKY